MPKSARRPSPCTAAAAALLLATFGASAQPGPKAPERDCSGAAQWQAGLAARPSIECPDEGGEAYLLGRELERLRAESRAIERAGSDQPAADRGAAQRRLRQLQIDIEAIEAEARLRGWSG